MNRIATGLDGVATLMFDFYGTVVDMQAGLTTAMAPYLADKGYRGDPGRVVTWWRRTHFENSMIDALLHREHTPYREIGWRALDFTLERAEVRHTDAEVHALVAAIERLEPFSDVAEALNRLRPAFSLVILSNGDPDMLAAGVARTGLGFDRVISVAEAESFKPHVATYRRAIELLKVEPGAVLFVASHAFDCVGAKSAGMRTAFIDRRGRPFPRGPHQPDLRAPDMLSLAEKLLASARPRPSARS